MPTTAIRLLFPKCHGYAASVANNLNVFDNPVFQTNRTKKLKLESSSTCLGLITVSSNHYFRSFAKANLMANWNNRIFFDTFQSPTLNSSKSINHQTLNYEKQKINK